MTNKNYSGGIPKEIGFEACVRAPKEIGPKGRDLSVPREIGEDAEPIRAPREIGETFTYSDGNSYDIFNVRIW